MTTEYLGTRDVPLRQLKPYPGNAKRGNVDRIRESLRRNGQYRSLVVRETDEGMIVLAGNHTLRAVKAEGGKTVRCEVLRCDDATARRINLADNRTAELGDYDDESLADLLRAAVEDDGTLEGTGFDDDDLVQLLENRDRANPLPVAGDADTVAGERRWGVIVEVDDEAAQVELLDRLIGEGLAVRALMA